MVCAATWAQTDPGRSQQTHQRQPPRFRERLGIDIEQRGRDPAALRSPPRRVLLRRGAAAGPRLHLQLSQQGARRSAHCCLEGSPKIKVLHRWVNCCCDAYCYHRSSFCGLAAVSISDHIPGGCCKAKRGEGGGRHCWCCLDQSAEFVVAVSACCNSPFLLKPGAREGSRSCDEQVRVWTAGCQLWRGEAQVHTRIRGLLRTKTPRCDPQRTHRSLAATVGYLQRYYDCGI